MPVDSPLEFCICAAIKTPSGEIIHGHRHNHCLDVLRQRPAITKREIRESVQGFVTSQGRFVDRKEGMRIQRASGKPSAYGPEGKYIGDDLFSEDLYVTPEEKKACYE